MGKVVRSITQPIQRGIGQLNPLNPGSAVGKAVQQVPGVKEAQNIGTQIFQPVEKAVVQPVSRGLASLDKAVGNAIPGGWGTLGTVAASMIPGGQFAAMGLSKTAAMTGLGALTGSGVMRPGRSFNLQGAVMGGAMAYGMSNLADYAAAAGGAPTVDTSGAMTAPVPTTPGVPLVTEPPMGIMDSISKYAGDVGRSITAPPSTLVQEPGIMDSIANSFSNTGRSISNFADAATTPSTYTDFGKSYAQNVSDIGSGIKNLITTEGAGKAAAAATGINPVGAAGATLFGATGLMALDEQEKMLKEQLANQQIAQAEYDQALGEINRQRDYAAKMVRENPFKLESTSDLSPDKTVYERTRPERNLYERYQNNLYAEGGDVNSSGISLQQSQRPYLGTTLYDNPTSIAQSRVGIDSLTNDKIKAIGNQLPPGIIAPPAGSINLAVLSPFYNPQTDEEFIAPSGGYTATPESGFMPGSSPRLGRTSYQKNRRDSRLYAYGGAIDDEMGGDYSAMGMNQGNLQRGLFGMGYKEGGNVSKKERQEFLDMINLEAKTMPPARYIEGVGFVTPPPAVQGRLGANIDALGGNVRAGASGMAMMGPDGKVITMPGMMDVGYRRRVGPGDLDVGLQRAILAMPGRDREYAVNANYSIPFAEGGQPRFLSGGGDGMSDSIPATIEGKQQARLADGEFVIPADVVSHLGNGSSKAGAKRLYAMMDKVRQERTGTTKQGKQINPRKFMPA